MKDGLGIVDSLIDEHRQSSFDVYFLRAKFLWRLGRHNDALKFVGICERFAPDNPDLLETKARIFASPNIQRFKEAEEIMRKLPAKKLNFLVAVFILIIPHEFRFFEKSIQSLICNKIKMEKIFFTLF